MSKRVLITGGAGFIGSNIAEALHKDTEVTVLDNLRTGFERNLQGLDVEFIKGNICDPGVLAQATKGVETVFHLAALVSVPESMTNEAEAVRINTQGTLNVLKAAKLLR